MKSEPSLFAAFAMSLALSTTLVGCGGGGSTSSPTPTPTPTPSPSQYAAPVTTVPAPTYPADTATNVQLGVFAGINSLRGKIGTGELKQNTLLDQAAQNHWSYVNQNGIVGEHTETPGLPGFAGAGPTARWTQVGFNSAGAGTEVMASFGATLTASTCIGGWENSVYHQAILFTPALDVGIAGETFTVVNPGFSDCTVDAATPSSAASIGQLPVDGSVLVYPYSGQTGVTPAFNNAGEFPNPAPDLNGAGHPIGVSLATQNHPQPVVVISQLTVTPQGGSPIAIRILGRSTTTGGPGVVVTMDTNKVLINGLVGVLPVAALAPSTTYTAVFAGTVDGTAVSKTWSFTTGQ